MTKQRRARGHRAKIPLAILLGGTLALSSAAGAFAWTTSTYYNGTLASAQTKTSSYRSALVGGRTIVFAGEISTYTQSKISAGASWRYQGTGTDIATHDHPAMGGVETCFFLANFNRQLNASGTCQSYYN